MRKVKHHGELCVLVSFFFSFPLEIYFNKRNPRKIHGLTFFPSSFLLALQCSLSCIPGSYTDTPGSTACKDCDENTFSAEKSRNTTCQACSLGRTSRNGSTVCSSCGAGKRVHVVGREETCVDCLKGFFTASADLKECTPCKLGRYQSDTGQASCLPCSPGEYQNVSGAIKCELCAESTYFSGKGRNTTCVDCPTGWISGKGSNKCQACGAGTFGKGCQKCPKGYARHSDNDDTTKCQLCKLGEKTSSEGSASCEKCDVGTYGNTAGFCTECPAGYIQDGKGEQMVRHCFFCVCCVVDFVSC